MGGSFNFSSVEREKSITLFSNQVKQLSKVSSTICFRYLLLVSSDRPTDRPTELSQSTVHYRFRFSQAVSVSVSVGTKVVINWNQPRSKFFTVIFYSATNYDKFHRMEIWSVGLRGPVQTVPLLPWAYPGVHLHLHSLL